MIYQTRHVSGLATSLMLAVIIIIFVCDIIIIATTQTTGIATFALLLIPIIISRFILKYFQQKIEIETIDDRIMVRYLNKPFCDHVTDRQILISDIKSYTLSDNSRAKYFTLHLTNAPELNITISSLGYTKNFDDMTAAIISLIGNKATLTN